MGCRHSSVDSSASSILPPRVRVPSTQSILLHLYSSNCMFVTCIGIWTKRYRDWPIFKIKNHCSATHHLPPQIIFKPVHFSFTSREALILETSCSTCSNAHSKYSECSLALDNPFNCSSFYSLSTKWTSARTLGNEFIGVIATFWNLIFFLKMCLRIGYFVFKSWSVFSKVYRCQCLHWT